MKTETLAERTKRVLDKTASIDAREQAIIDRHTSTAPSDGLANRTAKAMAQLEIESRRQQRSYAEQAPPETVEPVKEMLSNIGDRAAMLAAVRKLTPEQRAEALKLKPGVAQIMGDDRGGAGNRTLGAVSRGISSVSQPIQELVSGIAEQPIVKSLGGLVAGRAISQPATEMLGNVSGTADEIEFIRQFEAASQEFAPARPDDPWYARGPLQATEMAPWMVTVAGGAGIGRAAATGVAGRIAARGAAGGKIAGAVTKAGQAVGKLPTKVPVVGKHLPAMTAGKAGELAGVTTAAYPSLYAQEVDQLKAIGMVDDTRLRLLAGGTAVVSGLIEGIVPNPFKAGKVPLTEGATKAARQYLWEAAKRSPAEMSEEYLQGVTSGLGEHVAQYIDENAEDKTVADAFKKGWEQTKEAALPMAFLLGVPAGIGAGRAALQANTATQQRLALLEEIRSKGFVSINDASNLNIEGKNRKERLANVEKEIEALQNQSIHPPSPHEIGRTEWDKDATPTPPLPQQQKPPLPTPPTEQVPFVSREGIQRAMQSDPIGAGGNARAYAVSDDAVVRVPHQIASELEIKYDFKPVDHPLTKAGIKAGQPFAENSQGVGVLHRQKGVEAGLSRPTKGKEAQAANDARFAESIKATASLPQSAYDEFASTIKKMEAAGYTIDPSKSSNFLIDVENGRINIVDPIPVGKGGAGLNDMVVPLIGNTYMHNYKGEPLTPAMASIFSKAEQAAKNAGLDTTLSSGGEWSRELAGLNKKPVDPVSELDQAEDELAGLLGETTGEDEQASGDVQELPQPKHPDEVDALPKDSLYRTTAGGKKFIAVRGEGKRGGGDRLFETVEAANAHIERQKIIDQQNEEVRKKREEREAAESKQEADYVASFQGFKQDNPREFGRARKVLDTQRNYRDKVQTRKQIIEQSVADGAKVLDGRLERPDGTSLGEDAITKIGIQYAEHLIAARLRSDAAKADLRGDSEMSEALNRQADKLSNPESKWQSETRAKLEAVPALKGAKIEADEKTGKVKVTRPDGLKTTIHFNSDEELAAAAIKKGRKPELVHGWHVVKDGESNIYIRTDANHTNILNHEVMHWLQSSGVVTKEEIDQHGGIEKMANDYGKWAELKLRKKDSVFQKVYDALESLFSAQKRFFEEVGKRQAPQENLSKDKKSSGPAAETTQPSADQVNVDSGEESKVKPDFKQNDKVEVTYYGRVLKGRVYSVQGSEPGTVLVELDNRVGDPQEYLVEQVKVVSKADAGKPELAPDTARIQAERDSKEKAKTEKKQRVAPEGYALLPEKTRTKFEAAWDGTDQQAMKDLLGIQNKALRAEFERRSDSKLPRTVKGTEEVVDQVYAARETKPAENASQEKIAQLPWSNSSPEDESKWHGTKVNVAPANRREEPYSGKVVRVLNSGDMVEVQPDGQDGTFRVDSARITLAEESPTVTDEPSVEPAAEPLPEPAIPVFTRTTPDKGSTTRQDQADRVEKARSEIADLERKRRAKQGEHDKLRSNATKKRAAVRKDIEFLNRRIKVVQGEIAFDMASDTTAKLEDELESPRSYDHYLAGMRGIHRLKAGVAEEAEQRGEMGRDAARTVVSKEEKEADRLDAELQVRAKDIAMSKGFISGDADQIALSASNGFTIFEDRSLADVVEVHGKRTRESRVSQEINKLKPESSYGRKQDLSAEQIEEFTKQYQEASKDDKNWLAKRLVVDTAVKDAIDESREAVRKREDEERKEKEAEKAKNEQEALENARERAKKYFLGERISKALKKQKPKTKPVMVRVEEGTGKRKIVEGKITEADQNGELYPNGLILHKSFDEDSGNDFAITHAGSGLGFPFIAKKSAMQELIGLIDLLGLDFNVATDEKGALPSELTSRMKKINTAWDNGDYSTLSEQDYATVEALGQVAKTDIDADLILTADDLGANGIPPGLESVFTDRGLRVVKGMAAEVPEFAYDPVFTVKDGMLLYRDGYEFNIDPTAFNLHPSELKEGQTVGINLEDFGIKRATPQDVVAQVMKGTGIPRVTKNKGGDVSVGYVGAIPTSLQQGKDDNEWDVVGGTTKVREIAIAALKKIRWRQPGQDGDPKTDIDVVPVDESQANEGESQVVPASQSEQAPTIDPFSERSPESTERRKLIAEAKNEMRPYYQIEPELGVEEGIRIAINAFVAGTSDNARITGGADGKALGYDGSTKKWNVIIKRAQSIADKTNAVQAVVAVGDTKTGIATHAVIISSPGFVGSTFESQNNKPWAWGNIIENLYDGLPTAIVVPNRATDIVTPLDPVKRIENVIEQGRATGREPSKSMLERLAYAKSDDAAPQSAKALSSDERHRKLLNDVLEDKGPDGKYAYQASPVEASKVSNEEFQKDAADVPVGKYFSATVRSERGILPDAVFYKAGENDYVQVTSHSFFSGPYLQERIDKLNQASLSIPGGTVSTSNDSANVVDSLPENGYIEGPKGGKLSKPQFEVGERVQVGNSQGIVESVNLRWSGTGPKGSAYKDSYKVRFDSGDLANAGSLSMDGNDMKKASVEPVTETPKPIPSEVEFMEMSVGVNAPGVNKTIRVTAGDRTLLMERSKHDSEWSIREGEKYTGEVKGKNPVKTKSAILASGIVETKKAKEIAQRIIDGTFDKDADNRFVREDTQNIGLTNAGIAESMKGSLGGKRDSFAKLLREQGLVTDGRILMKVNDKDRDAILKGVGETDEGRSLDAVSKMMTDGQKALSRSANAMKPIGYRGGYLTPRTVVLQSQDGDSAIIDKSLHDTILKKYPNAVPYFLEDGKPISYAVDGDLVAIVMPMNMDKPDAKVKDLVTGKYDFDAEAAEAAKFPPPQPKTKLKKAAEKASKELSNAVDEFGNAIKGKLGMNLPLNPEVIAAAAKVVAKAIQAGTLNFAELMERMVTKYGDKMAERMRGALQQEWDKQVNSNPIAEDGIPPETPQPHPELVQPEPIPLTSVKNAIVDELRIQRGEDPMPDVTPQTIQQWLEAAGNRIANDPYAGNTLVEQLLTGGKTSVDEMEGMVLQYHYRAVNNLFVEADIKLRQAKANGDPALIATAQDEARVIMRRLTAVETALDKAGTAWGRAGVSRQIFLKQDFSLASMVRRARVANGGNELSDEQVAKISEQAKQIEEMQKRIAELEAKTAEQEQAKVIDEAIKKDIENIQSPPAKPKSKMRLKAEERVASALAMFGAAAKGKLYSNPIDPEVLIPAIEVVKAYFDLGVVTFREFMSTIAKNIGAKEAKASKAIFRTAWDQLQTAGALSQPDLDLTNPGKLTRFARSVQRTLIENGIREREEIVDGVHEALQEIIPDITRRQTMDALSSYGQFSQLSKDPIDQIIRDINGQLQQLAKLEDMEKGQAPAKTGVERRSPTAEERRLTQLVNEAKRRGGFVVTDPETQLKSAMGAAKTAVKNRIADMNYEIKTGSRVVRNKTELIPDAELEQLRKDRDELQKIHKEMFPPKGATEAQKVAAASRALDAAIASLEAKLAVGDISPAPQTKPISTPEIDAKRARLKELHQQRDALRKIANPNMTAEQIKIRSLDKSIAELEKQLAAGDFTPKPKPTPLTSPEIDARQAKLEELRATKKAILAAANPKMTPEQRASRAYEAHLRKQLAIYLEKIAQGDFAPKPKKQARVLTQGELALKKQLADVKHDFFEALSKYHLDNLSPGGRAIDIVRESAHLSRAIMTSIDLSAVLRQGGLGVYSHPAMARKAAAEMWHAIWSREKEFQSMEKLRTRPNAQLYEESGLNITDSEGKLTRQEEAFMGRWARTGIDFAGEKVQAASKLALEPVAASARAYVTFINNLRADLFDVMVENLGRSGQVTKEEAKLIATYVNVATGRADLKALNNAAATLNTVFFAPRYVASRFQYLAMPFYLMGTKDSGRVKKLIAKEYARTFTGAAVFIGSLTALSYLAYLASGDDDEKPSVEFNPLSSDFGKVRIDETRLDPLAGLAQVIVFSSRMLSFHTKSSVTGKVKPFYEGGPYETTHASEAWRFMRTKFAPVPGAAVTAMSGMKDVVGDPVTPAGLVGGLFVPISLGEVYSTMRHRGIPKGTALALLNSMGAAVNTYGPKTAYLDATPEERSKQVNDYIKNMNWESELPAFSQYLQPEDLKRVRDRQDQRRGDLVHDAMDTVLPKKDYKTEVHYEEAVERHEKVSGEFDDFRKQYAPTYADAVRYLSHHYDDEGGVKIKGKRENKPGFLERRKKLAAYYQSIASE